MPDTEPAEISADQVLEALGLGGVRGPQPVVGQAVQVGSQRFPRARGRDADDVHPHPGADPRDARIAVGGEERLALGGGAGAVGEVMPDPGGDRLNVDAFERLPLNPEPPLLAAVPDGRREEGEVPAGDDVDRSPHQGALHGAPLFQRPRERIAPKVPKA